MQPFWPPSVAKHPRNGREGQENDRTLEWITEKPGEREIKTASRGRWVGCFARVALVLVISWPLGGLHHTAEHPFAAGLAGMRARARDF